MGKTVRCKKCGTVFNREQSYCHNCGAEVDKKWNFNVILHKAWYFIFVIIVILVSLFTFVAIMVSNTAPSGTVFFYLIIWIVITFAICMIPKSNIVSCESDDDYSSNLIMTKDNFVSHISASDYQKMREREEVFWENKYDLNSVNGINRIPIVGAKTPGYDGPTTTTGQLEYYLWMKAGRFEKQGELELALACYQKAHNLIPVSKTNYGKDYYLRLPKYLRKLRRFDEARAIEAKVDKLFPDDFNSVGGRSRVHKIQMDNINDIQQYTGSDLVVASYIGSCCEECAKYRERVYSRYGHDRRFPLLPDSLKSSGHNCGISLYPFTYGVSSFYKHGGQKQVKVDPIKYSNRPFIDNRTDQEKEAYTRQLEKKEIHRKSQLVIKDYEWLYEFLPDICPKSVYKYSKERDKNSELYQEIVRQAKSHGRSLE